MSDILETIDAALERKGLTDAAASRLAVGNPSLIKNMRNSRGRYSFEALKALATVLDLECHFGPRSTESGATGFAEAPAVFSMAPPAKGGTWSRLSSAPPDVPFYFRADFDICDRLACGWHGLVEPAVPLEVGDLAYGQDADGAVAVFRLRGESDRLPDAMLVDPLVFGTGQESWSRADFARLHPVTWTGRTPPPTATAGAPPCEPDDRRRRFALELERIIGKLDALKREAAP